MNIRKLNRAIHRDLGYFFFAMCIIYGLSGIALNHSHDWNPNYSVTEKEFYVDIDDLKSKGPKEIALYVLEQIDKKDQYRTHLERGNKLRIYIHNGSVNYNIHDGMGFLEQTKRRPVFYEVNFLHQNTPKKLWTWFSNLFAASLIIMAVTGLFIIKGKNGITNRGAWLVSAGIIIPLILLLMYLNG